MAGSISVNAVDIGNGITRYSIDWTAAGSGAVSGNTFGIRTGRLLQAKFVPGAASEQPTAAYDVTLTDADSVDLLRGAGANLSETAASLEPDLGTDFIGYVEAGNVDLVVANAGAAAAGRVDLLVGP